VTDEWWRADDKKSVSEWPKSTCWRQNSERCTVADQTDIPRCSAGMGQWPTVWTWHAWQWRRQLWEFPRSQPVPENVYQVLRTKVKFETNFTGSSKYGISVLHSNILTFKLLDRLLWTGCISRCTSCSPQEQIYSKSNQWGLSISRISPRPVEYCQQLYIAWLMWRRASRGLLSSSWELLQIAIGDDISVPSLQLRFNYKSIFD